MFDGLSGKLTGVFDRLTRRGALRESDVAEAMREVRIALLEADVALPVVKDFVAKVSEKAVGEAVIRSVTPGQMVIKIVQDELTAMLGAESVALNLNATPPIAYMMVGLQGSGKTTSAAKIGLRLQNRAKKKVLLASLDVHRPAAQEQLMLLGAQAGVGTLPIVKGEPPEMIAARAMSTGRREGYDVVILDTAGRLHIDDALMAEAARVRDIVKPTETLLVADAMTGQDAVTVAKAFADQIGITGIVLTRVDGDARGGAALSARAVTGQPIKLIGVGEKLEDLEDFHPERIASRILGMGDIVSLVEKAADTVDKADAEKLAAKMQKGTFDLEDMRDQLRQVKKMGGLGGVMGMLPGAAKIKAQMAAANVNEKMIARQEAIINSMTAKERRDVKLLNASRKRRIAAGAGAKVEEVNRLVKQFMDMSTMMRKATKMGQKGIARHGMAGLMPGGRR
ncbi:MAG TPA: signal recognition particle protein [Alphaproteobacteria bacterium]|jgi:signal recognition particle subunit SRP54